MWEGGADSSHFNILHSNSARPDWVKGSGSECRTSAGADAYSDMASRLTASASPYGLDLACIRRMGSSGKTNVRSVPIILPTGRVVVFPDFYSTVFDTPIDDVHTSTYIVDVFDGGPWTSSKQVSQKVPMHAGLTETSFPDFNTVVATAHDTAGQDRAAMTSKDSWTGFKGIMQEDAVIGISMGPRYDRSTEHLVQADMGIVRLRQRLLESLQLMKDGESPIGLDLVDLTSVTGSDKDVETLTLDAPTSS